jgi:hypothetical protein
MALGSGYKATYIGQSLQREPLDKTNLRNGVDAFLGDGGGTFWKLLAVVIDKYLPQTFY